MLYREIIAVCSQIHTKHINTLCGQNVELLNVKLAVHIVTTGGTYSDHWALTLILLTWRIWWAPNNASRWQMGFNSAFKGLMCYHALLVKLCSAMWPIAPLLTYRATSSLIFAVNIFSRVTYGRKRISAVVVLVRPSQLLRQFVAQCPCTVQQSVAS